MLGTSHALLSRSPGLKPNVKDTRPQGFDTSRFGILVPSKHYNQRAAFLTTYNQSQASCIALAAVKKENN